MLREKGWATAAVVNAIMMRPEIFGHGFDAYGLVSPKEGAEGTAANVNGAALSWLDRNGEKPFFLFLHYYDVHSSYAARPEHLARFARPYVGIADGSTDQLKRVRLGEVQLDAEDARHLVDLYDAGIRQLDEQLGRLVEELSRRELLERTLLVVTSDHGEEFLEHGGVLHGRTLYRELVHVPLLFRGPSVPRGRRESRLVSLVDVAPTVAARLGVPAPEGGIRSRSCAGSATSSRPGAELDGKSLGHYSKPVASPDAIVRALRGA